jgi:hypothetical protein
MVASFLWRNSGLFGLFHLDFEPFNAYLKSVHRLDSIACRHMVIITHKTKTLAQIGFLVYEHFGRQDATERHKCLSQLEISELTWQMVNEQVASIWPFDLLRRRFVFVISRVDRVIIAY